MTSKSWVIFVFLTVISLLFRTTNATAGFEDLIVGARYNSLAGAGVAMANDPEAIYVNPAGLSQLDAFSTTLFYARPFGLKELSYGSLSAVLPVHSISFGLAVQSFGNNVYKENTFSSGIAYQLTRHLMIGATIRYAYLAIHKYGSTGTVALDIGLLLNLSPKWKWGFSSRNLNRTKIGQNPESLPQIFQTGLSVKLVDRLRLNCDLYKDVRFPLDLRCGVEARLLQKLMLRIGFGSEPSRISGGIGLLLGKIRWDYAFYTHTDLGLTHQMSISLGLNSKD